MCSTDPHDDAFAHHDADGVDEVASQEPDEPGGLSRRHFMAAAGVAAGALVTPSAWLRTEAAAVPNSLTGGTPLRLAMHVHGPWSEGAGSWDAQFAQAAANGFDVLYLSDHDFRAMAMNYATSLNGVPWVPSSSGAFAQKAQTASAGTLRLLAESSSSTGAASVTMAMQEKPFAFNRFRTSIAGLRLVHKVTSARLTNGALYEIVLLLSYHPATGGRPAGQYRLVYRFGGSAARFTEGNGLTGVVRMPAPAAGSTQTLAPETDVAALWPGMLAIDNCSYLLSFTVRSPRRTAVADVKVASTTFTRSQNSAAAVIANQTALVQTYQPRYPDLMVARTCEVSRTLPDMNPFGIPQWFPDYASLPSDHDGVYRAVVDQVHGMGGLISWNHPFGYNTGPLFSPADATAKRRQLFRDMLAVDAFGVDIMEVGYSLRGNVDTANHIALWDTFSRNGTFLTGNGASDDHGGQGWRTLNNGFATGAWATARTEGAIQAAFAAGRAYTTHIGRWPGGQLDLLVDGTVPMGAVSVSTKASRSLAIWAAALPAGSSVQVVAGPVDYAGQVDPGTAVVRTLAPSAFVGGVATISVDTSASRFFRVQVLGSDGRILGTGNPVWLLRTPPPNGIPAARR
jgi:hypothetical protein